MTAEIHVYCDDGALHEKRGSTNIITLRRLDKPGLDGAMWREVPVQSNKKHSYDDMRVMLGGSERRIRETVITADGERLTGVLAGRTRSEDAAKYAGYDPDSMRGSTLHFDLRCSTCGRDPNISSANMDRLLDGFHAAGYTRLELMKLEEYAHILRN